MKGSSNDMPNDSKLKLFTFPLTWVLYVSVRNVIRLNIIISLFVFA